MAPIRPGLYSSVEVVQRLIERFDLQQYPIAPDKALWIPSVILLTSDVDELLRSLNLAIIYNADPGATGNVTVHTVPKGKRHKPFALMVTMFSGATLTTTELNIGDGTLTIPYDAWAASASQKYKFTQEFWLPEGWFLEIYVNAYTAADVLRVTMLYQEEDAF